MRGDMPPVRVVDRGQRIAALVAVELAPDPGLGATHADGKGATWCPGQVAGNPFRALAPAAWHQLGRE